MSAPGFRTILGLLFIAMIFGITAPPICAQPTSDRATVDGEERARKRTKKNRERWRQLSPEKRSQLRKLHQALRELDPEKRQELKRKLRELSPNEASNLLRNRKRFHGRESTEREEFRHRHAMLRRFEHSLPPEERERLRELPREEFRQFIEKRIEEKLTEYRQTLSAAEQAKFDRLDPRQRLGRLHRSFMERKVREYRASLSAEERSRFDGLDRRAQHREMRRALFPHDRRRGPGAERRGRGGERMMPPSLRPYREELERLSPETRRRLFREGSLPEGVEISPELRQALEELRTNGGPPPRFGPPRGERDRPGESRERGRRGGRGPRDGEGRPERTRDSLKH